MKAGPRRDPASGAQLCLASAAVLASAVLALAAAAGRGSTTATPARLVERARIRRALEALQVGDLEAGDVHRETRRRSSNCS